MSSEIDKLREAIEQLTLSMRAQSTGGPGGGSGSGGNPTPQPRAPRTPRVPQQPPVPGMPPVPQMPRVPRQPQQPPPVPPAQPQQPTPATKPVGDLDKSAKGASFSLGKLTAGFLTVGTILKGLQGTKEGYLLNYSFQHLAFELADMFRGPIRFITRELEGLARVIRFAESGGGGRSAPIGPVGSTIGGFAVGGPMGALVTGMGSVLSSKVDDLRDRLNFAEANRLTENRTYSGSMAITEKGIREQKPQYEALGFGQLEEGRADRAREVARIDAIPFLMKTLGDLDEKKRAEEMRDLYASGIDQMKGLKRELADQPAQQMATKPTFGAVKPVATDSKDSRHLEPILNTSFGGVTELWQKMQALSTENPAQEKGLSLIEQIAKWVYMIAHPTTTEAEADKMFNPVRSN